MTTERAGMTPETLRLLEEHATTPLTRSMLMASHFMRHPDELPDYLQRAVRGETVRHTDRLTEG